MNITTISIISIVIGFVCLVVILTDVIRHPQSMKIMNIVWPVTALYAGPLGLIAYYLIGRKGTADKMMLHENMKNTELSKGMKMNTKKPFWQSVLVGTLHCGSGCTIGDIIAETFLLAVPVVLFGSKLHGGWLLDYAVAFAIGIVFQYYAIKPMKHLSTKDAIIAALKADTLSLTFWQIGMYGWMAISIFVIFHHLLPASDPVFWFMMQIAMLLGLLTAYPINWWLLKKGIKEAM